MNNINEDLIKYNTYIKVDDEFVACLREENFDKKSDRWLDFYPTDQFIELLEKVNNIITGAIREKTIRIIGSFGTGKTFAALTLKKILESSEDGIVEYFKRYQDNEKLCKLKEKYIQQSSKKIVTINVTASMGITSIEEMIDFIEDEIIKILKKKNMSISYDQTIVHLLKNKLSVPAKVHINDEIIKNQQFDGKSIDEILSEMDDENVDPDMRNKLRGDLIDFCEDKGLFIKKSQIIRNFKKWIGDIIKKNDISAFFFIWDEFQDLLEKINNLSDFQEHILGAADEKFFFVPITHVGDMNIDSGSIKKIRDRYESINIDLPDSIAFQLIGHAINPDKLDDNKSEEWKELRNHLSEPLEKAQTTIANKVKVDKDVMNKLIPMHPYAAYLLKYIAKEFQSNQRSLFQFFSEVKSNGKTFREFIESNGPLSNDRYLDITYLWDYIYDSISESTSAKQQIRILNKYKDLKDNSDEKERNDKERVLKAILLMTVASTLVNEGSELLKPTAENLELAFSGTTLEGAETNIAEKLHGDGVIGIKKIKNSTEYLIHVLDIDEEKLNRVITRLKSEQTSSEVVEKLKKQSISKIKQSLRLSGGKSEFKFDFRLTAPQNIEKEIKSIYSKLSNFPPSKIHVFLCVTLNQEDLNKLNKVIIEKQKEIINKHSESEDDLDKTFIFLQISMGQPTFKNYIDALANESLDGNPKDNLQSNQILQQWVDELDACDYRIWIASKHDLNKNNNKSVSGARNLCKYLTDIYKNIFSDTTEIVNNSPDTLAKNTDKKQTCGQDGLDKVTTGRYSTFLYIKNLLDESEAKKIDYWKHDPDHELSRLKIKFDEWFQTEIKEQQCVYLNKLYKKLNEPPYGFGQICLFEYILGIILSDYIKDDAEYFLVSETSDKPLSIENMRPIINDIIINPGVNKYQIRAKTDNEKAFAEQMKKIFKIERNNTDKITNQIIAKLKDLGYPLWALNEIETDVNITDVIDKILGIVNTNNYPSSKGIGSNDVDRANIDEYERIGSVGKKLSENINISNRLQELVNSDNCKDGMKKYLNNYKNGQLKDLVDKLEFNRQYLTDLKGKFTNDSLWLWKKEHVDDLIDDLIREYEIIDLSRNFSDSYKVIIEGPNDIMKAWHDFLLDNIRVSYDAVETYLPESDKEFLKVLVKIARNENINLSEFQKLLKSKGRVLDEFIKSKQKDALKQLLSTIEPEIIYHIEVIYTKLAFNHFADTKNSYIDSLSPIIKNCKENRKGKELLKLWEEKTNTKTPKKWSEKHKIPILCFFDLKSLNKTKSHFDIINNSLEKSVSYDDCNKALDFLQGIDNDTWENIRDNISGAKKIDEKLLGEYSIILKERKDEIKYMLEDTPVYDWYPNEEIKKRIQEKADYIFTNKKNKIIDKIDKMDAQKAKDCLKQMVDNNTLVALEFLKGMDSNDL